MNQTSKMNQTRTKFIAGNWKMNKLQKDSLTFVAGFIEGISGVESSLKAQTKVDVAIAPPLTSMQAMVDGLKTANLLAQRGSLQLLKNASKNVSQSLSQGIHAKSSLTVNLLTQNCHFESKGAFTGEVSAAMIEDLGCAGSIVGHSERRQYFGETNESVGKKWKALVNQNLLPVVCVGETKEERQSGKTVDVVERQLLEAWSVLSESERAKDFVVAYEPVWAIGTGLTATPEEANEVHKSIRSWFARSGSPVLAERLRILYGGSMNTKNAKALLSSSDIDGGLIGGASLEANEFLELIRIALEC
jgi:triosephosphate isomerase